MIISRNRDNTAFKSAIFVNMAALEKQRALPVLREFEKVLGQGLKQKSYKFGNDIFEEDIFIGYNKGKNPYTQEESYGVLIATGLNPDSGGQLFSKLAQIDTPILQKINKVLEKFNLINNPSIGVVKTSPSDFSGVVNKFDDDVEISVSNKFINALDSDFVERLGYNYYSNDSVLGRNVIFSYRKTPQNVYQHLFTEAL